MSQQGFVNDPLVHGAKHAADCVGSIGADEHVRGSIVNADDVRDLHPELAAGHKAVPQLTSRAEDCSTERM